MRPVNENVPVKNIGVNPILLLKTPSARDKILQKCINEAVTRNDPGSDGGESV